MADLAGSFVPETEEEWSFFADVMASVEGGHDLGVDRQTMATGLAFAAAAVMSAPDRSMAEPPAPTDKPDDCPDCGHAIQTVYATMGGSAHVAPCGCTVPHEEVEGWFE